MIGMHPTVAIEFSAAFLVLVAVLSVLILVLIIVAPWRQVRDEPPMDKAVEAKLLRAGATRVISPYKTSGAEMAASAMSPLTKVCRGLSITSLRFSRRPA